MTAMTLVSGGASGVPMTALLGVMAFEAFVSCMTFFNQNARRIVSSEGHVNLLSRPQKEDYRHY